MVYHIFVVHFVLLTGGYCIFSSLFLVHINHILMEFDFSVRMCNIT